MQFFESPPKDADPSEVLDWHKISCLTHNEDSRASLMGGPDGGLDPDIE